MANSSHNPPEKKSHEFKQLPKGQTWFNEKRGVFSNLLINKDGTCAGVALEGMVAFFADELIQFANRYEHINASKDLAQDDKSGRDKIIEWSLAAKADLKKDKENQDNLLKDLEKKLRVEHKNDEIFKEKLGEENKKLQHIYNQKLQEKISDLEKKYLANISPEQKAIFEEQLQVRAATEIVAVYYSPYKFPFIFPEKSAPKTQNNNASLQLLMPKKLEEKGGLKQVELTTGIYSEEELNKLFQLFNTHFASFDGKVGFSIICIGHAIFEGYQDKKWIHIDANQLPFQQIQDYKIVAKNVLSSLSCNQYAEFTTKIYVETKEEKKFQEYLNNLKNSAEWQALHNVTPQKARVKSSSHDSWLHLASRENQLQIVMDLLENGAEINLMDARGVTSLSLATQEGHLPIVEILLTKGANPNLATQAGVTPLCTASGMGYLEIAKTLLKGGADPNLATKKNETPLFFAARNGHYEIVQELLKKGANPNIDATNFDSPLYSAALHGHVLIVKELLKYGARLICRDEDSALHAAASQGHLAVVEVLLNHNLIKINQPRTTGETALSCAAKKGHIKVVKKLLEVKAIDVNQSMFVKPLDLLQYAETKKRKEAVENLLNQYKPNNTILEKCLLHDFSPLHAAVFYGHVEIAKALLDKGGDIMQKTAGISTLELALAMNNEAMITLVSNQLFKKLHTLNPDEKKPYQEVKTSNECRTKLSEIKKNIPKLAGQLQHEYEKKSSLTKFFKPVAPKLSEASDIIAHLSKLDPTSSNPKSVIAITSPSNQKISQGPGPGG